MSPSFYSDQPIKTKKQDDLHMVQFVERLVQPIVDWPPTDSVVLGLYAPWGSGKTSVLNLLETRLQTGALAARVLTVRFNPWLYHDADALLRAFFATLKEATRRTPLLTKARRESLHTAVDAITAFAVPTFAPLLALATGGVDLLTPAATATKTAINATLRTDEQTFEAEKKKAAKILGGLTVKGDAARLVVLVDDLDRAAPAEVRAMLRLVRLIADLPNVTYVLAMDSQRVRSLLNEGPDAMGASYLDKIVQIAVPLPPMTQSRVMELVLAGVREISTDSRRSVHDSLTEELDRRRLDLGKLIMWRVRTLRDRARLLNAFRFVLLSSPNSLEINVVDALLIGFLQTFYPDLLARLRANRTYLTKDYHLSQIFRLMGIDEADQLRRHRRVLAMLLDPAHASDTPVVQGQGDEGQEEDFEELAIVGDETAASLRHVQRARLTAVVFALFPGVRAPGDISEEDAKSYRRFNQIAASERFDRYFVYADTRDATTDEEVDKWLAAALEMLTSVQRADGSERLEGVARKCFMLREGWSLEKRADLLGKLRDRDSQLPPQLIGPLALVTAHAATRGYVGEGNAADLIRHFLKRATDLPRMEEDDVEVQAGSNQYRGAAVWLHVAFAHLVGGMADPFAAVEGAAEHVRRWDGTTRQLVKGRRRHQLPEEIVPVVNAGLARARTLSKDGHDIFEHDEYAGGAPIWRWRDLLQAADTELTEIRHYLRPLIDRDPTRLPRLLGFFAGWSDGAPTFAHTSLTDIRSASEEIFGWVYLLRAVARYRAGGHTAPASRRRLVETLIRWIDRDADAKRESRRRDSGSDPDTQHGE